MLSPRRGTARRHVSAEILKSVTARLYENRMNDLITDVSE